MHAGSGDRGPLPEDQVDLAVEVFRMLADPTRVRILWALIETELSVGELAGLAGKAPASVSQHLAKLRMARLVRTRRDGTTIFYRLDNDHVARLITDAVQNAEHAGPGIPSHHREEPHLAPGQVTSADGTTIAYDRQGSGPAMVLVCGGLDDGSENAPLARELAAHFTVYNYARRGRAGSTDTSPHAVDREIEDISALIQVAGGSTSLFGASSGGMLALQACAAGLPVETVAVYEVPYDVAEGAPERVRQYRQQLEVVLGEGRRGEAVKLFMRLAGVTEEGIAGAESSPYWPGSVDLAHTLAYDAAFYGPPPTTLGKITQPVLVATGGSNEYFEQAADVAAAAIPHARRRVLAGQGHIADPAVLGGSITEHHRLQGVDVEGG